MNIPKNSDKISSVRKTASRLLSVALIVSAFSSFVCFAQIKSDNGYRPQTHLISNGNESAELGVFQQSMDIGNPKNAGSSSYDKVTHTYTMKGSGYNIWFNRDEFQYLFRKIKGDFTATANFKFKGETGNGHRKVGWMIRKSTEDKSIHVSAVEHGDGLTVLQWRSVFGENMKDPEGEIFFPEKTFDVVQLQRVGKKLTMRVGHVGEKLQTVGSHTMVNIPDDALLGLFICSHDPEKVEEAEIWDVRIEQNGVELKNAKEAY